MGEALWWNLNRECFLVGFSVQGQAVFSMHEDFSHSIANKGQSCRFRRALGLKTVTFPAVASTDEETAD